MSPIYKAGLVLLRRDGAVCLVQVKAKNPEEQHQVDFGLPKGTRRYRATDGTLHDARDAATAVAQAATLEPLLETVREEAAQEIGLPHTHFDAQACEHIGVRPFVSRKGDAYGIDWYMMQADDALVLGAAPEAHQVRWFTMDEVRALHAQGRMNDAYVAVIAEVLTRIPS